MNANLNELSTLHLLIELMYQGKAEIIDEIIHFEPFSISEILEILRERAGEDYGQNFDDWFNWFMHTSDVGTQKEKENLRLLKSNKDRDDYYVNKIKGPDG